MSLSARRGRGGFRGVYHRAGPPGPASGRLDGRLRPDPVAQPILRMGLDI